MEETDHLRLPYLIAAQAQKHVTHNEALRTLDALVHLSVVDRDLAAPPALPAAGDRYLVGIGASGAWSGHDGDIAAFQDGAWMFHTPRQGWVVWVADEASALVFDGAGWVAIGGGGGGSGGVNPTPLVGVNATADTVNRLSVAAQATLFSHDGDDHRLKINKATAGDTAAVLFQAGFSGRAEIGLTGDDDFHFKVSPDGTAFHEAIVIDKDTGEVSFPNTALGGGGGGTNPNLLINGDFQINQREFGGGALAAGAYGFDRWKAGTGGSSVSVSGFVATLEGPLEQVVEPAVWGLEAFASAQVTVSVQNAADDLTVTFGSASGTIAAGSGQRSVTLTLGAGDTGNLTLEVKKQSGSGSTTFERIKLEPGAAATPWQARDAFDELMKAQRYYYRWGYENGDPGTGFRMFGAGTANVYEGLTFRHPAAMRAVPTMGINGTWFTAGVNIAPAISDISTQSANFFFRCSGGGYDVFPNSSDDYIWADAEL